MDNLFGLIKEDTNSFGELDEDTDSYSDDTERFEGEFIGFSDIEDLLDDEDKITLEEILSDSD